MHKHPRLTESRIENTIARIRELIHGPGAPLDVEAAHVHGEPITYEEATAKTFAPFAVGERWGPAWDTTWFRMSGKIPAEWSGREVVALVTLRGADMQWQGEGFTAEGLVWKNGNPVCAINVNRSDVPLSSAANGGEAFEFYLEAAANPRAREHGCVAELLGAEPNGAPQFILQQAALACFNRDAYELWLDFRVANETMLAQPVNTPRTHGWVPAAPQSESSQGMSDPRKGELFHALNNACNIFDTTGDLAATRESLRAVLAKKNGPTTHTLSAIGHAHIDTAWLWPLRETIRKCARTFSTALRYMEEYPAYVFGCSQPQQYAWMKEFYPAIFAEIKAAVKRGQWEPIGSMWIEADCNLSSGEALIRQILHGKNFFAEEFGVETTDVWLPDVFGYSASMPQIMKKAGVKFFITQKISWSQFNKFPHHTFLWEGIDGTRIFTHFPPADTYNANMDPRQLVYNLHNFKEHDRATRSLYVYGHGDGGGGPTREMLEIAARVQDLEGLPKVVLEKVADFLPKAEADARDLPVWSGELYLEMHRGTYTTQARNKKGNRKSEFLLRDAEFFDVVTRGGFEVAANLGEGNRAGYDVIAKDGNAAAHYLDRAWKLLLLNQFHDIIPGSSIHWVYNDSDRDYAMIAKLARAVLEPARASLAAKIDTSHAQKPLIVFNTNSFARSEVVSLPDGPPIHVEVPACGYTVVDVDDQRRVASFAKPVEAHERGRIIALDNGMLRVVFERETGSIRSIKDYRVQREVLAPGKGGNVFQLHADFPNSYDAWEVEIFYRENCEDIGGVESIEITENTSLRATVRIVRKFGKSCISQHISLTAGSPRIDFDTEVDWQEDHKFLKVAFPVNVRSPRATYEIQYGHVERPTHYNTTWDLARFEVCAQKWADLSEGDYGVALLNDCKYGYDIFENVMRLSLLRAPTAPDPVADRGRHQFIYSLLPHTGDFRDARVLEHAYSMNVPLELIAAEPHAGELPKSQSFFQVDRPGVIIEAIKKAEREEAIIVRFYEAHGTRGPVTLTTSLPVKEAFTVDLMERTLAPIDFAEGEISLNIAPFEIVTLKLV